MRTAFRSFPVLAILAWAAGCAPTAVQTPRPELTLEEAAEDPAASGPRLQLCGMIEGVSWTRVLTEADQERMLARLSDRRRGLTVAAAPSLGQALGRGCDVFIKFTVPGQFGDSNLVIAEAYSTRSKKRLSTQRGNSGSMGGLGGSTEASLAALGPALDEEFSPGSAFYEDLLAEKQPKPAAASESAAAPAPVLRSDVDAPRYRSEPRPDDFALIVGIEKYHGLPEARFAERDAQAVRSHLEALGVPPRNTIVLTGAEASRAGLVKNLETRLPQIVNERSTVYFYYSGHGAPEPATGEAYLVPADGDPEFLQDTAYPLERLYQKLGALKAEKVVVALDSCFSGSGGRSVLAKGTRPLVARVAAPKTGSSKIAALTASEGSQISGTLEGQGHGLFTYYFLRGLNGAAKDADGAVTLGSLYDYLLPNVQDEARRSNRDQSPQFLPGPDSAAAKLRLR